MNFKFELNDIVNVKDGTQGARIITRTYSENIGSSDDEPYYGLRTASGDGSQSIWENELEKV